MMERSIFKAYDIRGVYGKTLNPETALKLGLSFGTFLGEGKKVLIGRDLRTSSIILQNCFSAGLLSTGCKVIDAGIVPSPVLNYGILKLKADAGVVVTASHNPPEFNGFKLNKNDGTPYKNEKIRRIFESEKFSEKTWETLGAISIFADALEVYRGHLKKLDHVRRPFKIVVDCCNGTTSLVAPKLFVDFGCEVINVNSFPDERKKINIREYEANETRALVRKTKAEFGVIFDEDGDRAVFIDNKGRFIQSEKLIILFAREILRGRKGKKVVITSDCSRIAKEELKKLGAKVVESKTGYPFVIENIKKNGAVFAGEYSYHFYFPEEYLFSDGMLACLKLMEILGKSDRNLSDMLSEIQSYPVLRKTIKCEENLKSVVLKKLTTRLKRKYKINIRDGVKIVGDEWWVLIRPSNTLPLIRIVCEAKERKTAEKMLLTFENLVKKTIKIF